MSVMFGFTNQMAALMPMGDAAIVYSDRSYQALFDEGYPVKTVMKLTLFGVGLDIESSVVEVSRDPIAEELFVVPANFRRVNSLSSLF